MPDGILFVETRVFAARRPRRMSDEEYRRLQSFLLEHPQAGDVVPGCGGLRKLRFGDESRGKGKRGGVRIIYLDLPAAERLDLITIYHKDEKADLSPQEKKVLRYLVTELRREAASKAGKRERKS